MSATSEWGDWEQLWRGSRVPAPQLEDLIGRARRSRRMLRLMRLLSPVVALVALAVVGAALRHAGNAVEIGLGALVAVGICVVWVLDVANQRRADESVVVPGDEYVALRR